METWTSKKQLLLILLLVTGTGVHSGSDENKDSSKPDKDKDPAETNVQTNELIMENGLVSNQDEYNKNEEELERKEEKNWKGGEKFKNISEISKYDDKEEEIDKDKEMENDDTTGNVKDNAKNNIHQRSEIPSVTKRLLRDYKKWRWDKAIVPFIFMPNLPGWEKKSIIRAMAYYEYWTCFRFVIWDSTTKTKYGLTHNNYLRFVKSGGCWSFIGNLRRAKGGQPIACCSTSICLHEIAHSIGFNHEQSHPDRGKYLRVNFQYMKKGYASQYNIKSRAYVRDDIPYNLNSIMHYPLWYFRTGSQYTMTVFDPRLKYLPDRRDPTQFYMLKEAVTIYKCKDLMCSDFKMKCENDGYVSVINNTCACRCIKGLDPKTGCTTLLRENKAAKTTPWLNSNFAFLRPNGIQCPNGSEAGSVTQVSGGGWTSGNYQAMGDHNTQHFCTFNGPDRTAGYHDWPKGEYCISRVGGKCPPSRCPDGWTHNPKNDHCYKISSGYIRHYKYIREYCRKQGAYVVTINDAEENDFVDKIRNNKMIWIGINDVEKDDTWVWENGEKAEYRNWWWGYPTTGSNSADCGVMYAMKRWLDLYCGWSFRVMCEKPYPEFQKGSIEFEDDTTTTGVVPDTFTEKKSKFEFCCRRDGNKADIITLPSADKFILWQTNENGCQSVRDTIVETNYFAHKMKKGKAITKNGITPLSFIKDDVGYLYFCAYRPISRNCGGIIELTDDEQEKNITSPYYPQAYHANMECTWVIKSPPNTKIVLTFDVFEIPSYKSRWTGCKDSLEIRFSLPEHPGVKYCGHGYKIPVYSIVNFMSLILDSNDYKKGKRFAAKAKMVKEDDLCYDPKDYGLTYRGKVSFTRGLRTCLPWSEVTHCVHSPNNPDDHDKNLIENYCRNPKSGTQPWCYTKSYGCVRDYCDVCGRGKCLDLLDNCAALIKENSRYCSDTSKWKDGIVWCAKSCGLCAHQSKIKYTDITCSPPTVPKNATLQKSSTIHIGQSFKIKYNISEYNTYTQTCKGNETLTKLRECPDGWTTVGKKCVKVIRQSVKGLYAANQLCKKYRGYAVTINNERENKVIHDLVKGTRANYVIGLTDGIKENEFVWYNQKPATYTNWESDAPNNWANQDCVVFMYKDGKWNDYTCRATFPGIICQIDIPVNTCDDGTLNCEKFYKVENVAKGKEATQSSVFNNQYSRYGANNALNNKWNDGANTHYDNNPWWKVDLKQIYKIDSIVLVTRQKCCGSFLRDLVITVGESEQDMKECVKYEGYAKTTEVVELRCTSPLKGRYVKVQRQGRGFIGMAEVMINSFTE